MSTVAGRRKAAPSDVSMTDSLEANGPDGPDGPTLPSRLSPYLRAASQDQNVVPAANKRQPAQMRQAACPARAAVPRGDGDAVGSQSQPEMLERYAATSARRDAYSHPPRLGPFRPRRAARAGMEQARAGLWRTADAGRRGAAAPQ